MKPIPGFSGYFADDQGRIFRLLPSGSYRELRGWINRTRSSRYRRVWVKSDTGGLVQKYFHYLVALAFKGPPPSGCVLVRHGPGGPLDNSPLNIEWGTSQENAEDKTGAGNYLDTFGAWIASQEAVKIEAVGETVLGIDGEELPF